MLGKKVILFIIITKFCFNLIRLLILGIQHMARGVPMWREESPPVSVGSVPTWREEAQPVSVGSITEIPETARARFFDSINLPCQSTARIYEVSVTNHTQCETTILVSAFVTNQKTSLVLNRFSSPPIMHSESSESSESSPAIEREIKMLMAGWQAMMGRLDAPLGKLYIQFVNQDLAYQWASSDEQWGAPARVLSRLYPAYFEFARQPGTGILYGIDMLGDPPRQEIRALYSEY